MGTNEWEITFHVTSRDKHIAASILQDDLKTISIEEIEDMMKPHPYYMGEISKIELCKGTCQKQ